MTAITQALRRSDAAHLGLAALALVTAVVFVAFNVGAAHIDLEVYRAGAQAWLDGRDVYGPLGVITDSGDSLPFVYPPFAMLAAVPLAVLPWTASVIALFAGSVALIFGTLYVVARAGWPSGGPRGAVLAACAGLPLALALEPVRDTFSYGQVNLVLLGLVAVDCVARDPRWPRGVGVGLAAAIKLTPAAFLLFFLLRRDFRAAAVAVATFAATVATGFVADAGASLRYWGGGLLGAGDQAAHPFRSNQSLQGALARMQVDETTLTVVWAVVVAALLAVVVYAVPRGSPNAGLALCGGFALVASPLSWSHHWVWAVPALAAMAAAAAMAWRSGAPRAGRLVAAVAVTFVVFVLGRST